MVTNQNKLSSMDYILQSFKQGVNFNTLWGRTLIFENIENSFIVFAYAMRGVYMKYFRLLDTMV
jgi:hypothetical protein